MRVTSNVEVTATAYNLLFIQEVRPAYLQQRKIVPVPGRLYVLLASIARFQSDSIHFATLNTDLASGSTAKDLT